MTDKTAEKLMPCLGCDDLRCTDCFESKCRELGYTRADSGESDGAVAYQIRITTGNWHECTWDEFEGVSHNRPNDARRLFTQPRATAVDVRDAERYRWLRDQNATLGEGEGETFAVIQDNLEGGAWVGSDLDQAIDAAIASREGE